MELSKDNVKRERIPKWERDLHREMIAKTRTIIAKQELQELRIGQIIKVKKNRKSYIVEVIANNNRIITVKTQNGRVGTINIADIITREAKIQGIGCA